MGLCFIVVFWVPCFGVIYTLCCLLEVASLLCFCCDIGGVIALMSVFEIDGLGLDGFCFGFVVGVSFLGWLWYRFVEFIRIFRVACLNDFGKY